MGKEYLVALIRLRIKINIYKKNCTNLDKIAKNIAIINNIGVYNSDALKRQ